MGEASGAPLAADGLLPSVEPVPVSPPVGASIPSALWFLDFEPQLADTQFGPERSIRWMVQHFYERRFDKEYAGQLVAAYFDELAQAIEAQSGETGTGSIGAADESAVAKPCAQPLPPHKDQSNV